jgi:hypothetical protein
LEKASLEVSDEDSVLQTEDEPPEEGSEGIMKPEELKEYLRKLNPEDFGRFTP